MIETFTALSTALAFVEVEQRGFEEAVALGRHCRTSRARVFFIGNGGSAAIASHMAEDWLKAGNIAAMAFNDAALITCLTNDLGYDTVFSAPLKVHGGPWDVLVAISSSGRSSNILKAVETAKGLKMR